LRQRRWLWKWWESTVGLCTVVRMCGQMSLSEEGTREGRKRKRREEEEIEETATDEGREKVG